MTLSWQAHEVLLFARDYSSSAYHFICKSGKLMPDSLPVASTSTLGGVKVGTGLAIDANGVLSLDVASASGVSF